MYRRRHDTADDLSWGFWVGVDIKENGTPKNAGNPYFMRFPAFLYSTPIQLSKRATYYAAAYVHLNSTFYGIDIRVLMVDD